MYKLLLTLVACFLATFVNPWGIRLWQYVLTELSHDTNRRYIAEWQPASARVDPWSGVALSVIAAVLVGAGFVAERRRRDVAGLAPFHWVATCVPLIAMAYLSVRHVPLAAIWTAPVIALLLTAADAPSASLLVRRFSSGLASLALVPIAVTVQYVATNPAPVIRTGGTLLGPTDPVASRRSFARTSSKATLITRSGKPAFDLGGVSRAIRVSMDGRNIFSLPARDG
jgi:hypothetical protein